MTTTSAERPQLTRNRWYIRLAAAAGVVALATAAVVVATQTGGQPTGNIWPATTMLDTFATKCVTQANSADEQGWTAVHATTVGERGVVTLRDQDRFATCEAVPGLVGLTYHPAHRIPQPSGAPDLWLKPLSNVAMVPPTYPLIVSGPVSGQASGMTLTLSNGTTVAADVANETAVALVPWDRSVPDVWTADLTNDLIVSVRVVDGDGVVLYEGPPL